LESGAITPQEIIDENLREMCMYDAIPQDRKSLWFLYLKIVIEQCVMPDVEDADDMVLKAVTEDCHAHRVASLIEASDYKKVLGIDFDIYESCIKGQTKDLSGSSLSFLVRDSKLVKGVGSVFHPSMSIEG
jgi:hypothetical protein